MPAEEDQDLLSSLTARIVELEGRNFDLEQQLDAANKLNAHFNFRVKAEEVKNDCLVARIEDLVNEVNVAISVLKKCGHSTAV